MLLNKIYEVGLLEDRKPVHGTSVLVQNWSTK